MSGSQHKKAEKARRKAERERLKREERRRNVFTAILVVAILGVGALVVGLSARGDRAELAAQQSELERLQSEAAEQAEAAASEAPADGASEGATESAPPGAIVPEDPGVEPGTAADSGLEPVIDDRPVACDAEEPADAGDIRAQFPGGPAEVLEDGVDYVAVVETSCGTVTFDLLEEESPLTVNSFVFLAQQGFFDGLEMFRNATSIGALQTGGGDQTNGWSIGYAIPDELGSAQSGGYPAGTVAMANAGPNSGGSQFFFVYDEQFDAAFATNRAYAVFGQVLEGLDVLEEIGAIEAGGAQGETPAEKVYMDTVTIEER